MYLRAAVGGEDGVNVLGGALAEEVALLLQLDRVVSACAKIYQK